jgi:putative tricarboxylic transport membrane protein
VACGAKLKKLGPDIGREEVLAPNVTPRRIPLLTHLFRFRRDFCAGGLMILFGLVAAVYGPTYRVGTLTRMGPGFMPTVLGIVLIVLGVLIAGLASTDGAEGEAAGEGNLLPEHPQWFAWLCILAGPALFVVFGSVVGTAPATFAFLFFLALGDRDSTWKSALILAVLVTVFGVLLFHSLLQIPMPVLEWKSPAQAWGL